MAYRSRRVPLTLLLAAGVATLALPVGAGPAGASPASRPAALTWQTCAKHFRCAEVRVPVDYAAPGAGTLGLALVEQPSTGKHPVGDLLMNPGGPGASGVQFLEGTPFPAALRSRFNLVSWDPRGVGESDPVTCVGAAQMRSLLALDPAPRTPVQVRTVVSANKSFDQACARHTSRLLLENMSTLDTALDLDRIRAALGQAKLNYFGFSYGTFIGETYAHRFPNRVRSMVLDGVIDPALSGATQSEQQAVGFQANLADFFRWCPSNKACAGELPGGAEKAYRKLMNGVAGGRALYANLKPLYGGRQRVTLGIAETAVLATLYSDQSWPDLALALQQGLAGDGSALAALAYSYAGLMLNGQYANMDAAGAATDCLDQAYPKDVAAYAAMAAQFAKVAPDFGPPVAWSNLTCAFWPVPAQGKTAPVHSADGRHLLLIGSTGDPATPYAWAKAAARQLGGARLLTRQGPGHTGYLYSTCVQRWTNQYLVTLALPPVGTICSSSS